MHDRAVPEEPVLSEELAVVGRDDHPRVRGEAVEELGEDAVDVADGLDLASVQLAQLEGSATFVRRATLRSNKQRTGRCRYRPDDTAAALRGSKVLHGNPPGVVAPAPSAGGTIPSRSRSSVEQVLVIHGARSA